MLFFIFVLKWTSLIFFTVKFFFSEAQIYRMIATCTDKTLEERRGLMDSRLAQMSQGHFPESSMVDSVQYVLQCVSCKKNAKREEASEVSFESIFKSYSGEILQFDHTEGRVFGYIICLNT